MSNVFLNSDFAKVPIFVDGGVTFTDVIINNNIAIGSNFNSKVFTGTDNILT